MGVRAISISRIAYLGVAINFNQSTAQQLPVHGNHGNELGCYGLLTASFVGGHYASMSTIGLPPVTSYMVGSDEKCGLANSLKLSETLDMQQHYP
jgi:hypothetical protein